MIGERIGAYQIVRKIGEGGMGTVWLAEHGVLGRRAAIKMLNGNVAGQADLRTRFFNEAKAAAAIQEPGIVQIFDFGQHVDGRAYIVMELLEGEALDKRLERLGRLSLPEALRIAQQVAVSLGAAHQRGIVHRDLKPDNVFLVKDAAVVGGERTKLLDFGIAKLSGSDGSKTETSVVMGTPLFMSPEQCRGAGKVDQRSDIYSLGCLLFMMLTGRPPFRGEGPGDIIAMHLREVPPVPSTLAASIPHAVDSLVLRCLEKEAARRYSSGAEIADALAAIQARLTGSTPASSPVTAPLASGSMAVASPELTSSTEGRRASSAHATTLQPYSQVSQPPQKMRRGKQLGLWLAAGGGTVLGVVAMVLAMSGGEPDEMSARLPEGSGSSAPLLAVTPVEPEPTPTATPTPDPEPIIDLEPEPPPAPTPTPVATPAPVTTPAPAKPAPAPTPSTPVKPAPGKPPRPVSDDVGLLGNAKSTSPPAPPPVDCSAEPGKLETLVTGHYSLSSAQTLQAAREINTNCFSNKQLMRLLMIAIPAACDLNRKDIVLRFYALAPSTALINKCPKFLAR